MKAFPVLLALSVAIALSIPALIPKQTAAGTQYDVGLAVNILTLVMVAVYTYLTYGLLKHSQSAGEEERCRRRNVLANALLAELVVLEDQLRDLYTGPMTEYSGRIDFPVLRQAVSSVDLFDGDPAFLMTRLYLQMLRLEKVAGEHWDRAKSTTGLQVSFGTHDCNRVIFALSLLNDLQAQLRPLSTSLKKPWLTFPADRAEKLPLGESAFRDIPEIELGSPSPASPNAEASGIKSPVT